MEYLETIKSVDDEDYAGESPNGSSRDGYEIKRVTGGLARDIRTHAQQQFTGDIGGNLDWRAKYDKFAALVQGAVPTITVHKCWSGYSEYTITNVWSEISYNIGPFECHFKGVAHFIAAIADTADRIEEQQQSELFKKLTDG